MKKKTISKKDIQSDIIFSLSKGKTAMTGLSVLLCFFALCYVGYIICYAKGLDIGTGRFSHALPVAVIIIAGPLLLVPLEVVVFGHYSRLHKIKVGKFEIVEEKLCSKAEEWHSYYRGSEREKVLYFNSGRIAVTGDVYSYSNIGDIFYLAVINNGAPLMVYSKKFYQMEKE